MSYYFDAEEMGENSRLVSESDFEEIKNRLKLIFDADPDQYVNDFAIKRKSLNINFIRN